MRQRKISILLITMLAILLAACQLQIAPYERPTSTKTSEVTESVTPTEMATDISPAPTDTSPAPTDTYPLHRFLVTDKSDTFYGTILTLAVLDTRQTALFHLTATQIPVTKADESPADLSEIDAGDIVLLPWNGVMRGEPPYALSDVTNIVRTDSARMSTYQLQIVASLPNEALAFDIESGELYTIPRGAFESQSIEPNRGLQLAIFTNGDVMESYPAQFSGELFIVPGDETPDKIGALPDVISEAIDETDIIGHGALDVVGLDLEKADLSEKEQSVVLHLIGLTFPDAYILAGTRRALKQNDIINSENHFPGVFIALRDVKFEGDTLLASVLLYDGNKARTHRYLVTAVWQEGKWEVAFPDTPW
ncbi:MAG TPA: hypothetical protein GXZ89_06935 [Fastidiosipila sp.]|nr:hypothetical protein [Fastidiosipila sp.]